MLNPDTIWTDRGETQSGQKGRARSLVVGKDIANISTVGCRARRQCRRLVRLLRSNDRRRSRANGFSTERAPRACSLEAQEKSLLQPRARVEQDVVPDRVLIEQSNARANYGLSFLKSRDPRQRPIGERSSCWAGLPSCPGRRIELIVEFIRERWDRYRCRCARCRGHTGKPQADGQVDLPRVSDIER